MDAVISSGGCAEAAAVGVRIGAAIGDESGCGAADCSFGFSVAFIGAIE